MKPNVLTLELYLDGELAGAEKAAVERLLVSDAAVAEMARRLQSQRALRAATMETYQPSAAEASALTAAIMDECADEAAVPVGRINPAAAWSRRFGAVAAMLLVAGGCFYFGRTTAWPQVVTVSKPVIEERYVVNVVTSTGEVTEHVFGSKDEVTKFVAEVQRMQNGTVVAGVM